MKYRSSIHCRLMPINNPVSFTECNVGYYRNRHPCELCTGNKIKTMTGDAADCDADEACDEPLKIPNAGHTACGRFRYF